LKHFKKHTDIYFLGCRQEEIKSLNFRVLKLKNVLYKEENSVAEYIGHTSEDLGEIWTNFKVPLKRVDSTLRNTPLKNRERINKKLPLQCDCN
jgi:hypothetical protein